MMTMCVSQYSICSYSDCIQLNTRSYNDKCDSILVVMMTMCVNTASVVIVTVYNSILVVIMTSVTQYL